MQSSSQEQKLKDKNKQSKPTVATAKTSRTKNAPIKHSNRLNTVNTSTFRTKKQKGEEISSCTSGTFESTSINSENIKRYFNADGKGETDTEGAHEAEDKIVCCVCHCSVDYSEKEQFYWPSSCQEQKNVYPDDHKSDPVDDGNCSKKCQNGKFIRKY
jgi:hypothetical protein